MHSVSASPAGLPARRMSATVPRARHAALSRRAGLLPWVPFWLSLGIGGWFWLPDEPGRSFYALLALLGLAAILAGWRALRLAEAGRIGWATGERLQLASLALVLVVAGTGLAGLRSQMVAAPVLGFRYYGPVEGRVIAIDRSARDRMRITLDRVRLHDVAPWKQPERVRISLLSSEALPEPGATLMLTAHLGPPAGPSEPGGFDFRRLAWFSRLGAVGYSRTPVLTVAPPRAGGIETLHRLRMSLSGAIAGQIGGQAGAVSAALMTGDRSGIEESTNELMRAANLYHIVSISGLHMSMLAGFAYAALRLAGAAAQGFGAAPGWPLHKAAAVGALIASAAYLWLSGGGVATERAFIMVAVMLLAIIVDRRAISLRTVAVAAVIILIATPEALTSPGFQMSFAATVALILVQGPWLAIAPRLPWWLRPLAMLFLSSLVAGLATSPIAAVHFGRIAQYGLVANLLVVPVVGTLVMPGGVLAAVLAPFGLAGPALWVMGQGVKWMLLVAEWIGGLDGAVTLVPAAPPMVLPLMGAGAMLMVTPALQSGEMPWLGQMRRAVGALMLILSGGLWLAAERPLMLISAEGDAVAIMTDAGRVPSKPGGGAFAVTNWLAADGDPVSRTQAAARSGWHGAMSARSADIGSPRPMLTVHHLTGKSGPANVAAFCHEGALIVVNASAGRPEGQECIVLDRETLQQSGAIALVASGGGFRLASTDDSRFGRAWTGDHDAAAATALPDFSFSRK
ncbi:competence protein ComEC [Paracoccus halophilus]|uniref:Competence protein ComEC n=1 Tax=Paracoccus halophilus TaxID=376733 RepID=A0A1I0U1Q3_9RHOB|nr:ComEC/Rec2 family competence protein [Paracoccus halophilus]SFA57767.1 competence protein ComEC [Paracoccus halophilus]